MNDAPLWVWWMVYLGGAVSGYALKTAFRDLARVLEREEHQQTVMTQGQEIARLRAQVALHVGKEK